MKMRKKERKKSDNYNNNNDEDDDMLEQKPRIININETSFKSHLDMKVFK